MNLPVRWDTSSMPRRKTWSGTMVTCRRCYEAGLVVCQTISVCEECQRRKALRAAGKLPLSERAKANMARKRAAQRKKAAAERYKAA